MSRLRLLFVLSGDFGEYVTASLFSRGQPFETRYALPHQLARYAPAGRAEFTPYGGLDDLEELVKHLRPDVVVLASGYLFPINRVMTPEALSRLVARLRQSGAALATTDPWLRIWHVKPGSRLSIRSVRQGGVDENLSAKMSELQGYLERLFRGVPHLFAVPLSGGDGEWLPFFNPDFVRNETGMSRREERDEWLFVVSKEDFAFLAGFDRKGFFKALKERIDDVLRSERNHLTFVGPAGLGRFLGDGWPRHSRLDFAPFCDFDAFESAVRRARIVAYWNVLSSSLLYCLYYRVPPIFFGKGHQAQVCDGLFEHVAERVYRGRPPNLLDLNAPLIAQADALIERFDLARWLDRLREDYARMPTPAEVIERVLQHHAQE